MLGCVFGVFGDNLAELEADSKLAAKMQEECWREDFPDLPGGEVRCPKFEEMLAVANQELDVLIAAEEKSRVASDSSDSSSSDEDSDGEASAYPGNEVDDELVVALKKLGFTDLDKLAAKLESAAMVRDAAVGDPEYVKDVEKMLTKGQPPEPVMWKRNFRGDTKMKKKKATAKKAAKPKKGTFARARKAIQKRLSPKKQKSLSRASTIEGTPASSPASSPSPAATSSPAASPATTPMSKVAAASAEVEELLAKVYLTKIHLVPPPDLPA